MFGKTRAAVAGVAVSLLVAGSTVFMATTAANATAPATYKATNVLGYGEAANGDHLANTLYNDVDAPAAEFGGKVITLDNDEHLFATDPVTHASVDLSESVWDSVQNLGFQYSYGVTGGLTSIQFDGKFWLWVIDYNTQSYYLFYSDGTVGNSGIIQMEDDNGDPIFNPYSGQTIGIDGTTDGIFFVKDEYSGSWDRTDLYFWDGVVTAGVGTAIDMDVDGVSQGSEVFGLRELDGAASFIVDSYGNGTLEQYWAVDENEVGVGAITTPDGHDSTDGDIGWEDLYWGGETSTNAYVQVRWTDYSTSDNYILTTTAKNVLYSVVSGTLDNVNTGDSIVFNDAYYYSAANGDLNKIVGTTISTVDDTIEGPEMFVASADKLYFAAVSYAVDAEWGNWGIHSVDTTGTKETIVDDWDYDDYDAVVGAAVDGKFFFQQYSDEKDYELWVHDADGTRLAVDINDEFGTWYSSSYPYYFSTVLGKAYISAYNWETGYEELYTVGTTTPAAPETLALGDSMYALSCSDDTPSVTALDSVTGARTDVGNDTNISDDCFGQPAYDPTTGISYAVDWSYQSTSLVQIDLTTGLRTVVGTFKENNTNDNGTSSDTSDDYSDPNWIDAYSMAIDNEGNAYVVDYYGELYTLDLETATVESVNYLNVATDLLTEGVSGYPDGEWTFALAVDPITNILYGAEYGEGNETIVYSIDKDTAEIDVVGNWAVATSGTEEDIVTMQFDSNGTLWVVNDCGAYDNDQNGDCGNESLWTVSDMENFDTTAVRVADTTYYGDNLFDDGVGYFEALLITRGDENNFAAGNQPAVGTLYSVQCDNSNPYLLTNVSTVDASGTGIGADSFTDNCLGQAAWNPVTKKAYVTDWTYDGNTGLSEVNVETGRTTFIGEFRTVDPDTSEVDYIDAYSIAIDNEGNAFMWNDDTLYSVNLATGVVEEIGASATNGGLYAMAVNPLNDKLYAIDYRGDYKYYEVNKATGALTQLGTYDTGTLGEDIESLQFDAAGVAYIEVDDNTLWKGAITAGPDTFTKIGTFTVDVDGDDVEYYTESLLYVPGSGALAHTGVDSSVATSAALGGFLALAAGVALVARRRRNAA